MEISIRNNREGWGKKKKITEPWLFLVPPGGRAGEKNKKDSQQRLPTTDTCRQLGIAIVANGRQVGGRTSLSGKRQPEPVQSSQVAESCGGR